MIQKSKRAKDVKQMWMNQDQFDQRFYSAVDHQNQAALQALQKELDTEGTNLINEFHDIGDTGPVPKDTRGRIEQALAENNEQLSLVASALEFQDGQD